jgi:hypothetical protein
MTTVVHFLTRWQFSKFFPDYERNHRISEFQNFSRFFQTVGTLLFLTANERIKLLPHIHIIHHSAKQRKPQESYLQTVAPGGAGLGLGFGLLESSPIVNFTGGSRRSIAGGVATTAGECGFSG